jgi:hypothetical protein
MRESAFGCRLRVFTVAASAGLLACMAATTLQSVPAQSPRRAASTDTSNWKIYRSDLHGFELKYPPTWSIHEGSGTMEDVLFCKTPYADASAGLDFAVQRNANPNGLSIDKWVTNELQKANANGVPQMAMSIGGEPAIRLQERTTYEIVARWKAQGILNIFYHSSPADLQETYAAILSTFKFL